MDTPNEEKENIDEKEDENAIINSPVSKDIILGVFAMMIFGAVGMCSGIFHWLELYIAGVGVSSVLIFYEMLRYRVPLPRHYRSARNVAMIMVSIALVGNLLYLFARGIYRLY